MKLHVTRHISVSPANSIVLESSVSIRDVEIEDRAVSRKDSAHLRQASRRFSISV
jgi:hypothetical protein